VKLESYPEVTKFSLASHGKWDAMKLTNYFLFCIHCHRFGWGYATENFEHISSAISQPFLFNSL